MKTENDPEVAHMSLQPLFDEEIVSQHLLLAHHPGQANYIWDVRTQAGEYVVRSPRSRRPADEDFWQGTLRLFEVRVTDLQHLPRLNAWLNINSGFVVPRVVRQQWMAGRPFAIVEKLTGTPPTTFDQLSDSALATLGRNISALHQHVQPVFGPLAAQWDLKAGQPLDQFWHRLKACVDYLLSRYYANDDNARRWAAVTERRLKTIPAVHDAAPILLDMDPTQFLANAGEITGLVDTELFVTGPREMELVGLEYLLDRDGLKSFYRGYTQIAPFPRLEPYRLVMRFWLRLVSFQGGRNWDQWMGWPWRFPS